jgi:hypothetical protein
MTTFRNWADAMNGGWARALSAPMTRTAFAALALLMLTLVTLKFSGLS